MDGIVKQEELMQPIDVRDTRTDERLFSTMTQQQQPQHQPQHQPQQQQPQHQQQQPQHQQQQPPPVVAAPWPPFQPAMTSSSPNGLEASMTAFHQWFFLQQTLANQQAVTVTLPFSYTVPAFFSSVVNTNTTNSTTPAIAVTPQCASPLYPINTLLQMQAQLGKSSTSPAASNLLKSSSASMAADFILGSLPASTSPSTSSSKKDEEEEEEEEEEEDEFIDIESVDVAIDGKEKRKGHTEFYRRMKCMRQQNETVSCAMCKSKVTNEYNLVAAHVADHADAGCCQCRLCGFQSTNKFKLFSHMRDEHPHKVEMFTDNRDMAKMCMFLPQCFPTTKKKSIGNGNADAYLTQVLKGSQLYKTCELCQKRIRNTAMIRHVQKKHSFKCKTCKLVLSTVDEQVSHQKETHQKNEPKMGVHYAPSTASKLLLPALEKCFPMN